MSEGQAKKLAKKAQPEIAHKAAVLDRELQTFRDDYRPPARLEDDTRGGFGADEGAPRSNEFPVKVSEPDPYDTRADIKMSLVDRETGATPFGLATITDRDIKWLEKKEQQAQLVDWNKFLANQFDLTNPAEAQFVYGIMPEYIQEREQQIDQIAEIQLKIAKIRLRGPQSKEDLALMYALKTGALQAPQGAVYEPTEWYPESKDLASAFNRGIFSPRRFTPGAIGTRSRRYDMAGATIPINSPNFGFAAGDRASKYIGGRAGIAPTSHRNTNAFFLPRTQ